MSQDSVFWPTLIRVMTISTCPRSHSAGDGFRECDRDVPRRPIDAPQSTPYVRPSRGKESVNSLDRTKKGRSDAEVRNRFREKDQSVRPV